VRFRRQVVPGDVLTMEVEIARLKGRVGRGMGRAVVGDERVCEAELMFAFAGREEIP
jgi:3-hydroxyacyl-[acyl-carrier-protein] dehydratase